MLRNYLITIYRQIKKNKTFSLINILGLAVGMSACLAISQYVFFHTSFDQFHANADRIVRIHTKATKNGVDQGVNGRAAGMMGPTLEEISPDVLAAGRFWELNYLNNSIIYRGDDIKSFEETSVFAADRSVFSILDIAVISGSVEKFDEPQKIILTASSAIKYFDDFDQAIGETLVLSGNSGDKDYELVAIVDDLPINSHIRFGVLISMVSVDNYTQSRTIWTANDYYSYLLLSENADLEAVEDQMNQLYQDNAEDVMEGYGYAIQYFTFPISRIHLHYEGPNFVAGVDYKLVVALSIVALIILIVAWINYLNLTLVKTVDRLREVGIRKAMGSSTRQVTRLFMMEAFVLNMLAFLVALTFTQFTSPYLVELTGLRFNFLKNLEVILILLAIVMVGTILIGYYPAIILRSFHTTNILIGNKRPQKVGRIGLRSALVSLQFIITFLLIATTITVWKQVEFMKSSDLGIPLMDIMVIKAPPGNINSENRSDLISYNAFKTEVLKNSGIAKITNSGEVPGTPIGWGTNLHLREKTPEESVSTELLSCGLDYLDFFELEAVAGRNLRQGDDPWTQADVVINEKLAQSLGFENPEDAIGAKLEGFYTPLEVRGVIENHHHISLHHDFQPVAYILSSWSEYYFVKFNLASLNDKEKKAKFKTLIRGVEQEWEKAFPDKQLDYFFLDEFYNRQYQSEDQFGKIFTTFSSLAILIACLGLFGLTSFTIQQRTKEIGIRKALGAQTSNLMIMLSKTYFVTISIAYVIAMPVAWIFMNKWLENYTFRIELGAWLLVIPPTLVFVVAIITIFSKLIKSIRINPADSLRYE